VSVPNESDPPQSGHVVRNSLRAGEQFASLVDREAVPHRKSLCEDLGAGDVGEEGRPGLPGADGCVVTVHSERGAVFLERDVAGGDVEDVQ